MLLENNYIWYSDNRLCPPNWNCFNKWEEIPVKTFSFAINFVKQSWTTKDGRKWGSQCRRQKWGNQDRQHRQYRQHRQHRQYRQCHQYRQYRPKWKCSSDFEKHSSLSKSDEPIAVLQKVSFAEEKRHSKTGRLPTSSQQRGIPRSTILNSWIFFNWIVKKGSRRKCT